jgi:hypothetical protein
VNKRAKIIDALLDRSEYVPYWRLKWGDLLRGHSRHLNQKGLRSFNSWLDQALRENRPLDGMVRELLTARGNLFTNGPVAFYFIDQTPEELAETTGQIFLGVRLQCAKCHHHPFEVWSQEDYYGMAAFFTGVQRKDTKEGGRYGGAQSISMIPGKTLPHPKTQKVVLPQMLGQPPLTVKDGQDPRQALAVWVTDKKNPFFARNIVNRYWGYMFGRGIAEPIDDMRATNPPSHPELLEALAQDFIDHHYDLKHLLRTICNSRTYQLASEIDPQRDRDGMFFTHHRPRQLPAEVLMDAINQAADVEELFNRAGNRNSLVLPGTRAIELPDPTVASYFLDVFSRPQRTSTCECDRTNAPDLSQVLHLANSEEVHNKVSNPKGRVAKLMEAKKTDDEILEELYLATLSRLPTMEDRKVLHKFRALYPSRQQYFEDVLWTLLNSSEFISNH